MRDIPLPVIAMSTGLGYDETGARPSKDESGSTSGCKSQCATDEVATEWQAILMPQTIAPKWVDEQAWES